MKKNVFATIVAGALCLSLSLPVATQAAEIRNQSIAINDAADLEKATQEAKLIEDKLFVDSLCEGTVEEYFTKRGASFLYDSFDGTVINTGYAAVDEPIEQPETGAEIGEPIELPKTGAELGDPVQKPVTKPSVDLGDPIEQPEDGGKSESDQETEASGGTTESSQEESGEATGTPQPVPQPVVPVVGGESERVAYVQIMRYYFGMVDKSLEEYAEYLRTEQGWTDEAQLQRILQLAFPDEYYAQPEPQPVPDDELPIDGGESERIAYVQSMRYYFGMTDKSLAEYAEYLRNEGWKDEEWLQHILSLAFPDEYYAQPEPQPVPDDELEIVY